MNFYCMNCINNKNSYNIYLILPLFILYYNSLDYIVYLTVTSH